MNAAFLDMPVKTFTCPHHGEYESRAPVSVIDHWCPICSRLNQAARGAAQARYQQQRLRHELWCAADVPKKYRDRTLDNWTPENKGQANALDLVKRYANDPHARVESGKGLLFLGPPGVGKTHLGCAVATASCAAGIAATYIVWADALERVKATFDGNRDHLDRDLMERLARVPMLVLDELGGSASDFDKRRLFELVDARYRESLPIVAVTNLTRASLSSLGERTADRLREMCLFVPIAGDSRRGTSYAMTKGEPAMELPMPPEVSVTVCVNGQMVARTSPIEL